MKRLIALVILVLCSALFAQPPKATICFVHNGGAAANALNGGATQTAWDAGTPDDFIGDLATGSAVKTDTGCSIASDGGGSPKVRITATAGTWADVVDGTVAWVDFDATAEVAGYVDAYTEVTRVGGDNTKLDLVDVAYISASGACDARVGGAIDTVATALDSDLANHALYNRTCLIRGDWTAGAYTIDQDGKVDQTTRLLVKGVQSDWTDFDPLAFAWGDLPEGTLTGALTVSGDLVDLTFLSFTGSLNSTLLSLGADNGSVYFCRGVNTNAGAAAATAFIACAAVGCWFETTNSGALYCVVVIADNVLANSRVVSNSVGVRVQAAYGLSTVVNSIISGTANATVGLDHVNSATAGGGGIHIESCTVDGFLAGLRGEDTAWTAVLGMSSLIANCIFSNCATVGVDAVTNTAYITFYGNAYYNCTADNEFNAICRFGEIASSVLTTDPFVDRNGADNTLGNADDDYRLNSEAAGGALLRGKSIYNKVLFGTSPFGEVSVGALGYTPAAGAGGGFPVTSTIGGHIQH